MAGIEIGLFSVRRWSEMLPRSGAKTEKLPVWELILVVPQPHPTYGDGAGVGPHSGTSEWKSFSVRLSKPWFKGVYGVHGAGVGVGVGVGDDDGSPRMTMPTPCVLGTGGELLKEKLFAAKLKLVIPSELKYQP